MGEILGAFPAASVGNPTSRRKHARQTSEVGQANWARRQSPKLSPLAEPMAAPTGSGLSVQACDCRGGG